MSQHYRATLDRTGVLGTGTGLNLTRCTRTRHKVAIQEVMRLHMMGRDVAEDWT